MNQFLDQEFPVPASEELELAVPLSRPLLVSAPSVMVTSKSSLEAPEADTKQGQSTNVSKHDKNANFVKNFVLMKILGKRA